MPTPRKRRNVDAAEKGGLGVKRQQIQITAPSTAAVNDSLQPFSTELGSNFWKMPEMGLTPELGAGDNSFLSDGAPNHPVQTLSLSAEDSNHFQQIQKEPSTRSSIAIQKEARSDSSDRPSQGSIRSQNKHPGSAQSQSDRNFSFGQPYNSQRNGVSSIFDLKAMFPGHSNGS